jgi:hypothetical protein
MKDTLANTLKRAYRRAYADEWADTVQTYNQDMQAEIASWPICAMCGSAVCPDTHTPACEVCGLEIPKEAANKAHDIA